MFLRSFVLQKTLNLLQQTKDECMIHSMPQRMSLYHRRRLPLASAWRAPAWPEDTQTPPGVQMQRMCTASNHPGINISAYGPWHEHFARAAISVFNLHCQLPGTLAPTPRTTWRTTNGTTTPIVSRAAAAITHNELPSNLL